MLTQHPATTQHTPGQHTTPSHNTTHPGATHNTQPQHTPGQHTTPRHSNTTQHKHTMHPYTNVQRIYRCIIYNYMSYTNSSASIHMQICVQTKKLRGNKCIIFRSFNSSYYTGVYNIYVNKKSWSVGKISAPCRAAIANIIRRKSLFIFQGSHY